MQEKRALITGITGQDGSYLAELLLKNGYEVFGLVRDVQKINLTNIAQIKNEIRFIEGDIADPKTIISSIKKSYPSEFYNLAAQSFVAKSWETPHLAAQINALGVTNILESIRAVKPDTKFYQASSSEMFGKAHSVPQNENTAFNPRTPYGWAKLYAHGMTKTYRESYHLFTCNGILFNHESERRGVEYVTRKITTAVAAIVKGSQEYVELGNLSATRDWGHAEDYVMAMYLMLQHETADDYVIATGQTATVRDFATKAFAAAGITLRFEGEGLDEVGIEDKTGKIRVGINPKFFRPLDVDQLIGNPQKAIDILGWNRKISFDKLIERMVTNDIKLIELG